MKTMIFKPLIPFLLLLLVLLPLLASAESCDSESSGHESAAKKATALKLKIGALVVILVGGFFGVSLPILGRNNPHLNPESNLFFVIKSFAAGVILATGFVHIFPDAFENLTSSCFGEKPPWGKFPLAGLVAMLSAVVTMMIDTLAGGFFRRSQNRIGDGDLPEEEDNEAGGRNSHVHVHSHGSANAAEDSVRYKVVSQVKCSQHIKLAASC